MGDQLGNGLRSGAETLDGHGGALQLLEIPHVIAGIGGLRCRALDRNGTAVAKRRCVYDLLSSGRHDPHRHFQGGNIRLSGLDGRITDEFGIDINIGIYPSVHLRIIVGVDELRTGVFRPGYENYVVADVLQLSGDILLKLTANTKAVVLDRFGELIVTAGGTCGGQR